jgi:hypothetical protein
VTLAEFLLARIADDEAVARRNWDGLPVQAWSLNDDEGFASVCIAAPRVLAECEAKWRIVDRCAPLADEPDEYPNGLISARAVLARATLRALALPYADHEDFRPEWKP